MKTNCAGFRFQEVSVVERSSPTSPWNGLGDVGRPSRQLRRGRRSSGLSAGRHYRRAGARRLRPGADHRRRGPPARRHTAPPSAGRRLSTRRRHAQLGRLLSFLRRPFRLPRRSEDQVRGSDGGRPASTVAGRRLPTNHTAAENVSPPVSLL